MKEFFNRHISNDTPKSRLQYNYRFRRLLGLEFAVKCTALFVGRRRNFHGVKLQMATACS